MEELIREVKKLGKMEGLLEFKRMTTKEDREDIVAIANLEYDVRLQEKIVKSYKRIYEIDQELNRLEKNKK